MKKIKKFIKNNAIKIVPFIIALPTTALFTLIMLSDAKFSDVFTTGRVSHLENRESHITRDIVVDTTLINCEGGVKALLENIIKGITKKRPNWRFVLLIRPHKMHDNFLQLKTIKNVKFIYPPRRCIHMTSSLGHIINFLPFCSFLDKIKRDCPIKIEITFQKR